MLNWPIITIYGLHIMKKEHFTRGTEFNERRYLASLILDAVTKSIVMPISKRNPYSRDLYDDLAKPHFRDILRLTKHHVRRAHSLHTKFSKEGVDIFEDVVDGRIYEKTYAKDKLIKWLMRSELSHMDLPRLAFFNLYTSCFDITSKDDFLDRLDNLCEKTQLTKTSLFKMPPKVFEFAFTNETKFIQDISCLRQISHNIKNWKDDPDRLISLYNAHCFKHTFGGSGSIEALPADRLRMLSKFAKDEIGGTKGINPSSFFAQRRPPAITPQPKRHSQRGGPR